MRNRNLIFSLVASSLFIPSVEALESTNDFDSLENENNYGINILIAEGGGGGGGMNAKKRNEKKLKDAVKSYEYFWDKREDAIEKGESTTKIDKKIKKYEDIIKKLDIYDVYGPNSRGPIGEGEGVNIPIGEGEGDDPRSRGPIKEIMGGGPYSRPKEPDTQEAEIEDPIMGGGPYSRGPSEEEEEEEEEEEVVDFGVSDEVATTLRGKSHIFLTRRINKRLRDDLNEKINVAISILKIEAGGVNNENIDQWIKKIGEYRLKISTLQDLQIRVNDFLNFNMDTNVYGMKFVDGKGDEYTNKGLRDKTRNFKKEFSSLKDELKDAGFLNSGETRLDLDYLFNRTDLFTERILHPANTNSDGKYQCKSDTCF